MTDKIDILRNLMTFGLDVVFTCSVERYLENLSMAILNKGFSFFVNNGPAKWISFSSFGSLH